MKQNPAEMAFAKGPSPGVALWRLVRHLLGMTVAVLSLPCLLLFIVVGWPLAAIWFLDNKMWSDFVDDSMERYGKTLRSISGMPNVKDEPRPQPARLVR
jgi:hypothetical protein